MTVWLIALVIMAMTAVAGYYQGVVRAAMSFIGLLVSAFLAVPLSPMMKPILKVGGVKEPFLQDALAPAVVFAVVLIIFKIAAQTIHHKINYHFDYKASERKRMHWGEFMPRVGLCVGLFNGAIYFTILMIPLYVFGYAAVQVSSDGDPAGIRFLSKARKDLHTTKFDKVLAAHDPASTNVYVASDIVGLIFRNPLLESRLARYPTLLSLAERSEFQDLANDVEFHSLWQGNSKVSDILQHPKVQNIVKNKPLIDEIQGILLPDLQDLREFLKTGQSAKYDSEKILGRWNLNMKDTIELAKPEKRTITQIEMRRLRERTAPFAGATLVATTDNKIFLKRGLNTPNPQSLPPLMAEGSWSKEGGAYKGTLDNKPIEIGMDSGKLLVPKDNLTLVFDKEL